MVRVILPFLLLILLSGNTFSQHFFRIRADFSIKEKDINGKQNLTMGKVYYDKVARQVVYDVSFPEKEQIILKDNQVSLVKNGKLFSSSKTPLNTDFTIFHLSLHGNLPDYGLKDSFYKIASVEKEKDMVITTWQPDDKHKALLGKIIISNINKKLHGIVIYNPENKIISKQIYKNYQNYSGLEFPSEVIEVTFTNLGEAYKVTTYKNIIINDLRDDKIYNYSIPK